MTSTLTALLNPHAGLVPGKGTYPIAANTLLIKNAMVGCDSSGRATNPTTADTSGNPIHGVSCATYDNRTGAEMGGNAGDGDAEVQYGVVGYAYTGTAPIPGDKLYAADNQTVSIDSLNGTRGFAGVCTEVRTLNGVAKAFFWCGPHVASLMAGGSEGIINLTEWRLTTGAAVPAFGAGTADGYSLTSSEGMGLRWNDDTTTAFMTSVLLPADLDGSKPVIFHAMGFRSSTLDITAKLTIAAFIQSAGDLVTADADLGGDTGAFDTAAASTLQEVTRTLAAVDVPEGPAILTMTVVPNAALDDDDLVVLRMWLTYSKR